MPRVAPHLQLARKALNFVTSSSSSCSALRANQSSTPRSFLQTFSRLSASSSLLSSSNTNRTLPKATPTVSDSLTLPTTSPSLLSSVLSPVLGQVRWKARGNEYQPSQRVRKRRHGFLARLRSRTGRKVLARRKTKGRTFLSH